MEAEKKGEQKESHQHSLVRVIRNSARPTILSDQSSVSRVGNPFWILFRRNFEAEKGSGKMQN